MIQLGIDFFISNLGGSFRNFGALEGFCFGPDLCQLYDGCVAGGVKALSLPRPVLVWCLKCIFFNWIRRLV